MNAEFGQTEKLKDLEIKQFDRFIVENILFLILIIYFILVIFWTKIYIEIDFNSPSLILVMFGIQFTNSSILNLI